jgi:predicted nucleic acid-binding protein
VVKKVVVDTSVLVDALEEGDEELLAALVEREVLVPYVALYEYLYGYLYLGRDAEKEKRVLEKLFTIVYPDQQVLMKALEIDVALAKEGLRVPQADIIIAATAIAAGAPLLTRDLRHYPRLKRFGLEVARAGCTRTSSSSSATCGVVARERGAEARALGLLLLEGKSRVEVELEETLVEDLPEEPDWDLHARVLHEWVPEVIRELLREAGVRNALIRHLKDDIQAPEYVAEGVAELGGREIPVTLHLDGVVDYYDAGEATLLYARVFAGEPPASLLPYYHPVPGALNP